MPRLHIASICISADGKRFLFHYFCNEQAVGCRTSTFAGVDKMFHRWRARIYFLGKVTASVNCFCDITAVLVEL